MYTQSHSMVSGRYSELAVTVSLRNRSWWNIPNKLCGPLLGGFKIHNSGVPSQKIRGNKQVKDKYKDEMNVAYASSQ